MFYIKWNGNLYGLINFKWVINFFYFNESILEMWKPHVMKLYVMLIANRMIKIISIMINTRGFQLVFIQHKFCTHNAQAHGFCATVTNVDFCANRRKTGKLINYVKFTNISVRIVTFRNLLNIKFTVDQSEKPFKWIVCKLIRMKGTFMWSCDHVWLCAKFEWLMFK